MSHRLAFALYLFAFILWVRILLSAGAGRRTGGIARIAVAGAVASHALGLFGFYRSWGTLPLSGLGPALSSFALVGGTALLAVALRGEEAARVGIVLIPFILVLQGVALAVGIVPGEGVLLPWDLGFVFHVLLALAGFQALAVAAAASTLYLVQFHELKSKRFGRLFRFIPSLDTLDRLAGKALLVGFPAMTIALILGTTTSLQLGEGMGWTNPKILWAWSSWIALGLPLLHRRRKGGGARRGALLTVTVFVLVLAGYLAMRLASLSDGRFV